MHAKDGRNKEQKAKPEGDQIPSPCASGSLSGVGLVSLFLAAYDPFVQLQCCERDNNRSIVDISKLDHKSRSMSARPHICEATYRVSLPGLL